MATGAVAVENPDVTSDREDIVVGFDIGTDKEGKPTKTAAMYSAGDEVKKLEAEGKFKPVFDVTVSTPQAKTIKGISLIVPDEKEAVNNFNRGARQKGSNRLRAKLLDTDQDGNFTFSEADLSNGVYDLTAEIASPTKRISLTEEEKLDRFLKDYPDSVREVMKKAWLSARQAPAAA